MFLHRPGGFAVSDHLITKAFIKPGDESTDEVTFLCEVGFGLEDEESGDILLKGLFSLGETFETGEGVRHFIRVAEGFNELLLEVSVGVAGVFS